MGEKIRFLDSLGELQKSKVADIILPEIHVYLDDILGRERLSEDADSIRKCYISLLKCSKLETRESVRKRVKNIEEAHAVLKHESCPKTSKLGQVDERRLISIRQFQIKQNQEKEDLDNKMDSPSDYITDEDIRDDENVGEFTKTDDERLSKQNIGGDGVNCGYLFHKETDGLRRRWCVLENQILKCYKRQNQNFIFEVNFREGEFSAIQGSVGKMYAISLTSAKAPRSYLFASPKSEVCASWMMRFSSAGVQLQDDILREVSMNQQNNNKVTWALDTENEFSEKDLFRSNLLEALEYIESSKSTHILPKRSSYSFKDLDVLRKLKASLVSKKADSKLNRRKTWSAGSFPNNINMIERFRKPISLSEDPALASENEKQKEKTDENEKTLPEILTSSGIMKVENQDSSCHLGMSVECVDHLSPSEDDLLLAVSMPEGLDKHRDTDCPSCPQESINAQSVPDLLILPGQESPNQSSTQQNKHLKTSVSLSRVMSVKASLVKNAIMTGLRRKGRRSGGRVFLDREQAKIHGCLYRKKGSQWKQRWCLVAKETFYAFRDSSYEREDFNCRLGKCVVMKCEHEPGRVHTFKLVRRKGDDILLAAEDNDELDNWIEVLLKETLKQRFSEDLCGGSRSSSLTTSSLYSVETLGDSSATEDTATDGDVRGSYYGETTDKDSSDEHSTTNNVSLKLNTRGINDKGYVYYLVSKETWEHCWMEVTFGVLSIYSSSENKDSVLQRDYIALCDIQENNTNGQRPYSFVFKKGGREPIRLEVDSETDYVKWLKCFQSWKSKNINTVGGSHVDTMDNSGMESISDGRTLLSPPERSEDELGTSDDNVLMVTRPSPICGTPATSDSDCNVDETGPNQSDIERPRIRRSMTTVLSQLTPKMKRRIKSNAATLQTSEIKKNASKSSFLYYKANSGLWVKYWCVLESSNIFCFDSPEHANSAFSVDIQGCEVRKTSHKSKNFTFEFFNRDSGRHFEFAGESTYVMCAWIRIIKVAAGLVTKKETKSSEEDVIAQSKSSVDEQPESHDKGAAMMRERTEETVNGGTVDENNSGQKVTEEFQQTSSTTPPPTTVTAPISPKRKTKLTSLDQVLKLLQEKQLEQQLQNKEETTSNKVKMKWQHSMLVVLRKSRAISASPEINKPSGAVVKESENVNPERDQKTARLKSREISQKYDHILEDEKLKMLRRETLFKKRRNSLILRKEVLEKKLMQYQHNAKVPLKKRQSKDAKEPLKKRQSKDAKEMATTYLKGDGDEVAKQLEEIKNQLGSVEQNIETNSKEQKKLSDELNEKKQKELHELRITADMSPHEQGNKMHRRQVSDSLLTSVGHLSEEARNVSTRDDMHKPKLTLSLSSPAGDIRSKAKSFSSSRLPKAPSSPLLRTKTVDRTSRVTRPSLKSRASEQALSAALSQIEDFEVFAQGSYRSTGADVGC